MWNENISCHINKQEMSQPSVISGLQMWRRAPQTGIQRMLPSPPHDCWGAGKMQETKWAKKQDWPQIAEEPMKGMHSVSPEACTFHIHRMLNSLPWYLTFDVQTACSLCCILVYCLTSPPASLEQFSLSYWDAVSQAQSPKLSHQINNSLLSGCDYTFQLRAASGLGCSPWDLHWVLQDSSSWLFSLVRGLQWLWLRLSCSAACGILVPWPGIEPLSPALQVRFFTTGPPGKSKNLTIFFCCIKLFVGLSLSIKIKPKFWKSAQGGSLCSDPTVPCTSSLKPTPLPSTCSLCSVELFNLLKYSRIRAFNHLWAFKHGTLSA